MVQKEVGMIADEVGRASSAVLQFSTDLGAIISSFGITGPLLDNMSTQLAKLAIDMASFSNASDEEAFNALRSGITGETEPLKRFGVVLTDANLKLFALEKGIKTKIEAMHQGQKTALRYAYIMEKTALAQGDAARTAESFANQSKNLAGEWKSLNEELGKGVTPALANFLGAVTDVLSKIRRNIAGLVADWQWMVKNMGLGGTIDPSTGKTLTPSATSFDPSTGKPRVAPNEWGGGGGSIHSAAELAAKKNAVILGGIDKMGGASAVSGSGGSAEAAKEFEKARTELMKALDEQSKANLENIELRKDELELKQRLDKLTEKEAAELERINRRLVFKKDVIEDATNEWEKQVDLIEKSEDKVKDLTKSIEEEKQALADANKEIEKDAQRSREEKAADLIKERERLNQKLAQRQGLSQEEQDRLAKIDASLGTQSAGTIGAGQSIAGMDEFQLIDREAALKKQDAEEKANARIAELQAELDAENKKLEGLRDTEAKKKQVVIDALAERSALTTVNYTVEEEKLRNHTNVMIAEYQRLAAAARSVESSASNAVVPKFASGGAVAGAGTETSDSIVARLSNGEHVLDAEDVRLMGGHGMVYAFRDMLKRMPRFAEGGAVTNHHNNAKTVTINIYGEAARQRGRPDIMAWDIKMKMR